MGPPEIRATSPPAGLSGLRVFIAAAGEFAGAMGKISKDKRDIYYRKAKELGAAAGQQNIQGRSIRGSL